MKYWPRPTDSSAPSAATTRTPTSPASHQTRRSASTTPRASALPKGVRGAVDGLGTRRPLPGALLHLAGPPLPDAWRCRRAHPRGSHHDQHQRWVEAVEERETIVFARQPDGTWLAVHEHLSPMPPAKEAN